MSAEYSVKVANSSAASLSGITADKKGSLSEVAPTSKDLLKLLKVELIRTFKIYRGDLFVLQRAGKKCLVLLR